MGCGQYHQGKRLHAGGIIDFRAWLIAQGKAVYLNALRDPDTLADVEPYGDCSFESIAYVGNDVYHNLTGQDAYAISILPGI